MERETARWQRAAQGLAKMSTDTIAQPQEASPLIGDPIPVESKAIGDNSTAAKHFTVELPLGWEIKQLTDALAGAGQEPPWVIKDLLLAGTATQISAHPHSMKSLAWLAAALEAAARQTVWGHFPATHVTSTLFIETEDTRWLLEERLRGLAKGLGLRGTESAPGFHYLRTGPFDLVKMQSTLKDILNFYKPDFAVLSTLQNLLGGRAWRDQDEMQDVNALFVGLADSFCPIVQITHSPWDSRQRRAIGTVSQAANFATSLHFQKAHTKVGTVVHVIVDSKLGAGETDFTLRLEIEDREVRRIVYEGQGRPKGLAKERVRAEIASDPSASTKEIAERAGVSTRYVQQQLRESVGNKRAAQRRK